jgi:hypothetical protein
VSAIDESRSEPEFTLGFARSATPEGGFPGDFNLADELLNIADFRVWPWIESTSFALRS